MVLGEKGRRYVYYHIFYFLSPAASSIKQCLYIFKPRSMVWNVTK
jgi:hypothetical protein